MVAPAELHRLAIVLYWGLFVAGSDELRSRLAVSETPAIAQAAGIRDGDLVVSVDDEPVRSWQDLRWVLLQHALDNRELVLKVRTLEDVEAFRRLDLAGVAIDEGNADLICAHQPQALAAGKSRPSSARFRKRALPHVPECSRATRCS